MADSNPEPAGCEGVVADHGFLPLRPESANIRDEGNSVSGMSKLAAVSGDPESKDLAMQENIIPLSPQWLFTKPGDSKPPPASMEPPRTPSSSGHGGNSDSVLKDRRRADGNRDVDKRRDWWRTVSAEADNVRRDRWREEERESSLLTRRDRWKEGGDSTEPRRAERWSENSADGRRVSLTDRWSDSPSREITFEARRDSKWSTRWGPEDRDKEVRREKQSEPEKEGDGFRDRHCSVTTNNRTENEREADSSRDRDRIWRPPSIASRGKGEMTPLCSTPPKFASGFGAGRGRGENSMVGFAVGRGRAGSSLLHGPSLSSPIGAPPLVDKCEGGQGFRYPRAKLLDIYRSCSLASSFTKFPEAFIGAPELTQAEPLVPLSFLTPDMEEETMLEGIWKGEVLGSGVVHSATGRSREDGNHNRARGRIIGNREGISSDAIRNDGLSDAAGLPDSGAGDVMALKHSVSHQSEASNGLGSSTNLDITLGIDGNGRVEKRPVIAHWQSSTVELEDLNARKGSSSNSNSIWRPSNFMEVKNERNEIQDKLSYPGQEDIEKEVFSVGDWNVEQFNDKSNIQKPAVGSERASNVQQLPGWYVGGETLGDGKTEVLDKFIESEDSTSMVGVVDNTQDGDRKEVLEQQVVQAKVEELSLFYTDPQGDMQGPFLGADIISWFEAGFFGTDLPVRLADAPMGTPFTQLGNIMPHLKQKAPTLHGFDPLQQLEENEQNADKPVKGTALNFSQQMTLNPMGQDNESERILMVGRHVTGRPSDVLRSLLNGDAQSSLSGQLAGRRGTTDASMNKLVGSQGMGSGIEVGEALLQRSTSLSRRMSAFPHVETEDVESSKQSLFLQHWSDKDDLMQATSVQTPGSTGRTQTREQLPQAVPWQPETYPSSLESLPGSMLDRGWPDFIHTEVSPHPVFAPGVDALHRQQVQQFEKQQLQQWFELAQAGVPIPRPAQPQQQHILSQVLLQQQASGGAPLEQLLHQAPSRGFNFNALQQQLLAAHPSPRQHQHQQQQPHFPFPAPGSVLDQVARLQQQQQQLQLPPHVLLEQLLRQQQHFPANDQTHTLPPLASQDYSRKMQESSRVDLEQLFHARHAHEVSLEQLFLQRQQAEQQQARQHAHPVQQQQSNFDEHRISGVWEVDEFGQFVRTQASTPMHTHETFHHHQQQHHQSSIPSFHHPRAQDVQAEMARLHVSNHVQPGQFKADRRTSMNLHDAQHFQERKFSPLLGGASTAEPVPAELLTHLEGQRGRYEGQNSLPIAELFPPELEFLRNQALEMQAKEAAEVALHRGWSAGPYDNDMQMCEMLRKREGDAPGLPQHSRQSQFDASNWQQDSACVDIDSNEPSNLLVGNSELLRSSRENHKSAVRVHQQSGKGTKRVLADGLSRLAAVGSFPLGQAAASSDTSFNEQRANSWLDDRQEVGHHMLQPTGSLQPTWNALSPETNSFLEIQQEEEEWNRGNSSVPMELLTAMTTEGLAASDAWMSSSPAPSNSLREIKEDSSNGFEASVGSSGTVLVRSSSAVGKGELAWGGSPMLSAPGTFHTPMADETLSGLSGQANTDVTAAANSDSSAAVMPSSQVFDDSDFMEPKETKKSKRRNSKGKASSIGKLAPVTMPEPSLHSSIVGKSSMQHVLQEEAKEIMPVPLPSPSLGDFLPIKEEPANSPPWPAWSVDLYKQAKAAKSLKEIQEAEQKAREEQERQPRSSQQQVQVATKLSNPMSLSSNASAWQRPSFHSPAQVFAQTRNVYGSPRSISHANNVKSKTGVFEDKDELFWDYNHNLQTSAKNLKQPLKPERLDNSTSATRRGQLLNVSRPAIPFGANNNSNASDFPLLSGFSVAASKPAPMNVKLLQANLRSEDAKVFRQWCEFQIKKLTGKDDMTLLDFCMSLPSTAEAGEYLTEYLGNGPIVQAFKAEFLRNKDLMASDIIHTVFPPSDAVIKDGGSEPVDTDDGKRAEAKALELSKVDENELYFETLGQNSSGRSGKKKEKRDVGWHL